MWVTRSNSIWVTWNNPAYQKSKFNIPCESTKIHSRDPLLAFQDQIHAFETATIRLVSINKLNTFHTTGKKVKYWPGRGREHTSQNFSSRLQQLSKCTRFHRFVTSAVWFRNNRTVSQSPQWIQVDGWMIDGWVRSFVMEFSSSISLILKIFIYFFLPEIIFHNTEPGKKLSSV